MRVKSAMVRRKITSQNKESPHFMPVDIVRAIEEVQAAGLTVYGVEITLAGAINISTQPAPSVSKPRPTPRQMQETDSWTRQQ